MINWKNIIEERTPLLGIFLSGPLTAIAEPILGLMLLGNEKASDVDIENAILHPTPAQAIVLQQIEMNLQTQIEQISFAKKKLIIQDCDRARLREIQIRDKIPALLAILLTVGFFSILLTMMFLHIEPEARAIINVMLGALGTAWISCITYYFGSSHGSQTKNMFLHNQ